MSRNVYDLLPDSASTLERDLSRSISVLPRIESFVPPITSQKLTDIPDSVVLHLIYERGLGEILPYFVDSRDALEQGVAWQRIRGTPQSLITALTWIGITATIDEFNAGLDRWMFFELDLGVNFLTDDQFRKVLAIAEIAKPIRSRLDRIYGAYNFRRFRLNISFLSGGDLLSTDSGFTFEDGDGVQQSFGNSLSVYLEVVPPIIEAIITTITVSEDLASLWEMSDFQSGWAANLLWGAYLWSGAGLNLTVSANIGEY